MLHQIDWKHIIDETDVDISWRNWQSAFLNVVSVCVPRKTLPRKKHLPWINPRTIKHRNSNSLLNTYKQTSNHHKLSQYKQARNQVVAELRKATSMFFRGVQDADPSKFLQGRNLPFLLSLYQNLQ